MGNGKSYVRKIHVPIYEVNVFVVVADDLRVERKRKKWVSLFGQMDDSDFWALCSRGPKGFGLFFKKDFLISKIVAHEVFHLTHRIMERVGDPFDSSKHEQGAGLYEWLWDRINAVLSGMVVNKRSLKKRGKGKDHEKS